MVFGCCVNMLPEEPLAGKVVAPESESEKKPKRGRSTKGGGTK